MTPIQNKLPQYNAIEILIQIGMIFLSVVLFSTLASFLAAFITDSIWGYSILRAGEMDLKTGGAAVQYSYKLTQFLYHIGMFLLPPLVMMQIIKQPTLRFLGLQKKSSFATWLLVVLLWLVSYPFIAYLLELNMMMDLPDFLSGLENWMRAQEDNLASITEELLNTQDIPNLLLNILVLAVMPAIAEELFFRGMLQKLFIAWFRKPHLAIFLSAFLFSAIHLQFYGFLPRFVLGGILGYVFWLSGNLKLSMLLHFINNGVAVVAYYFYNNDIADVNPNATVGPGLGILSLLITLLVFWFFLRKMQSSTINKLYMDNNIEWIKVYEESNPIKAQMILDDLTNEGYTVQMINKQDSSYQLFGLVEIYAPSEQVDSIISYLKSK